MAIKLTEDLIEKLACPAGRRDRLLFDTKQGGLAVRVTSGGAKSYLVQYNTVDGRRRRLPLDKVGRISLDSARKAAMAALGQVVMGLDPATERAAARKATKAAALCRRVTVGHLVDEWEARHLSSCSEKYRKEAPG